MIYSSAIELITLLCELLVQHIVTKVKRLFAENTEESTTPTSATGTRRLTFAELVKEGKLKH